MTQALTLCLLATALFASSAQAIAILPQKSQVVLHCRDARHIADAGVEISIRTVPLAHALVASVSEQSFIGPQPVGQVLVKVLSTTDLRITNTVYKGEDFLLTLSNENEDGNGNIPSVLTAKFGANKYDQDVICQVMYSAL